MTDRASAIRRQRINSALLAAVRKVPAENLNLALHLLQRLETHKSPGAFGTRGVAKEEKP
jgi:formiminotetrahydrofolate cyclodeaminase